MERVFQILAVILIGIAAFFLWNGNTDGLFIMAVAGAVCFFLSIRFQVGVRVKQREAEKRQAEFNDEEDKDISDKPQSPTEI